MGQITSYCCPFSLDRYRSQDSLSRSSSPSVLEQIEVSIKPSIKGTKNKKQLRIQTLQKQQSAYFNKNQIISLQQNNLKTNLIPIMGPKGQSNQIVQRQKEQDHSTYYSKIKSKIKPQIYKISTMDEEDSAHNASQFARSSLYFDEQSQQIDSQSDNQESKAQKNAKNNQKNSLTFLGNDDSLILSRRFRTQNHKIVHNQTSSKQKIQKLSKILEQEHMDTKNRIQIKLNLAKLYVQMAQLQKSKSMLQTCLQLCQQNKNQQDVNLKICVFMLLGCIYFKQDAITDAIDNFLKALRLIVKPQNQNIKIVEIYYWVGKCYLKQQKIPLAKDYLLKSLKKYQQYSFEDPSLLRTLFLLLGNIYHQQQQYAEADKYYSKGIKIRQENQNQQVYFQLLLRTAENMFSMDNYRDCILQFNKCFKQLRRLNHSNHPIFQQAHKSLAVFLIKIADIKISQSQLQMIVKITESLFPQQPQLQYIRKRLHRMKQMFIK